MKRGISQIKNGGEKDGCFLWDSHTALLKQYEIMLE